MGKKNKPDNQPFFIHFVNSELKRKGVFALMDKLLHYFPDDKDILKKEEIDEIKVALDIKKLENYKPKNEQKLIMLKRYMELGQKLSCFKDTDDEFFKLTKEEEGEFLKFFLYIIKKLSYFSKPEEEEKFKNNLLLYNIQNKIELNRDEGKKFRNDLYSLMGKISKAYGIDKKMIQWIYFYYKLKYLQLKIKSNLKKIIVNIKDIPLLYDIQDCYQDVAKKFDFGNETYLKKYKIIPVEFWYDVLREYGDAPSNDIKIRFIDEGIRPIVYYDLAEFLSNPDLRWKKLKQCEHEECKRFYIASVSWQRFCDLRGKGKCHDDFNRKKNARKKAKYMREKRLEKPEWIT